MAKKPNASTMAALFGLFASMVPFKLPYQRKPQKGGPKYYQERNFTAAPKAEPQHADPVIPRQKFSHRRLTAMGILRRKDGNKLGLRKRIALMRERTPVIA